MKFQKIRCIIESKIPIRGIQGGMRVMKKVIVYTSDTCTYCSMAKDYLKSVNVNYEERNVKQPEYRKELMAMKIMSVPVIKVGEETIIGFDKSALDKALF